MFELTCLDNSIPEKICDIILNEENWKGKMDLIKQTIFEFYNKTDCNNLQLSNCINYVKLVSCESDLISKSNSDSSFKHKPLESSEEKVKTSNQTTILNFKDIEYDSSDTPVIARTIRYKFKNKLVYNMDWKNICFEMGLNITWIIANYLNEISYDPEIIRSKDEKIVIIDRLKCEIFNRYKLKYRNLAFLDDLLD